MHSAMSSLFTAFPVPRSSALMGNRQNSQRRLSGSENDGKRKPVEKQTPIRRFDNNSDIGIPAQQVERSVHFGLEIGAQPREASFIVPGGIDQFLQGSGVELDSHP
jgi:hypothetical protein